MELDLNLWAVVRVGCSDKKDRVGIAQQGTMEIKEEHLIMKDLHLEYAQAMVSHFAKELNLEEFDNNEHEPWEW